MIIQPIFGPIKNQIFESLVTGIPAGGGVPSGEQVGFQPCHHCSATASASGHIFTKEKGIIVHIPMRKLVFLYTFHIIHYTPCMFLLYTCSHYPQMQGRAGSNCDSGGKEVEKQGKNLSFIISN